VPVVDECCLPSHFQRPVRETASISQRSSHVDCITDLAIADIRDRLLISSSRDGVVKIWSKELKRVLGVNEDRSSLCMSCAF